MHPALGLSCRTIQLPHHSLSPSHVGSLRSLSHLRLHPKQCQGFANKPSFPRHIFHQSKPHHPQNGHLRLRPAPSLAHRLLQCGCPKRSRCRIWNPSTASLLRGQEQFTPQRNLPWTQCGQHSWRVIWTVSPCCLSAFLILASMTDHLVQTLAHPQAPNGKVPHRLIARISHPAAAVVEAASRHTFLMHTTNDVWIEPPSRRVLIVSCLQLRLRVIVAEMFPA